MKKVLKIIGKVILVLLLVLAAFLIIMTIYNQIMLRKNQELYNTPLGQLVEVDGHNMSIYTEGKGGHTIVFLSGWGTSSPILDFKALYSRLSDENRIVVIERFGYGFSDVVEGNRDMDTILRQDREALENAGIEAPYVLCAHSMSGYEAKLWAQKYPDEVEAIVGLDMCTPNCEDEETLRKEEKLAKLAIGINKFEKVTGLLRIGSLDQSGTLTKEENKLFTEICCRKLLNESVIREGDINNTIAVNQELNAAPLPNTPMLLYISPDSTEFDENWEKSSQAMTDASENGILTELDCGHYIHDFEYERIAKEMKEFLK